MKMIHRSAGLCLALLMLVTTYGCDPGTVVQTPAERIALATGAGKLAFLAFVTIEKPTVEQQDAIKVTLGLIRDNLKNYSGGGFSNTLPGIQLALAKAFPDPAQAATLALCTSLSDGLLTGLDALFAANPTWSSLGAETANIVGAFCDGANNGFSMFLQKPTYAKFIK